MSGHPTLRGGLAVLIATCSLLRGSQLKKHTKQDCASRQDTCEDPGGGR